MRKQAATAKDGRVQQTNFDTYQMLRMHEAPAIEVHIVQNFEAPGGMGGCGTSAIVPAVANAIATVQPRRGRSGLIMLLKPRLESASEPIRVKSAPDLLSGAVA